MWSGLAKKIKTERVKVKKKNQNKKRLKWKRCHSCPRLHPRKKKKDVLMLGGLSQCALQSLFSSW